MNKNILSSLTLLFLFYETNANPLIVPTTNGDVLGEILLSNMGKKVNVWNSIPYGKPPIGDLRFKRPQPVDKWEGVKDVTKTPNTCMQQYLKVNDFVIDFGDSVMSEDCLYLTVVTPNPRPKNASVLFWFYGVGNTFGSSTWMNSTFYDLAANGDLIIVIPQFRVSVFGFLYTESEEAPGNAGLYDQQLALLWARDNIINFGGDPNRITLGGYNTGAHDVGIHLLSSKTTDLFKQGFMVSGSLNNRVSIHSTEIAKGMIYPLAKMTNCENSHFDISKIISCLKDMPAKLLAEKAPLYLFHPVAISEPDLQVYYITEVLEKLKLAKKDILSGFTHSGMTYAMVMADPENFKSPSVDIKLTEEDFLKSIQRIFFYLPENVRNLLILGYKNWQDPKNGTANRNAAVDVFTDYHMRCDVQSFIDQADESSWNVYQYVFDYVVQSPQINDTWPKPADWIGTSDGYENSLILTGTIYNEEFYDATEEDLEVASMYTKYLSNFVKTGSPNGDESNKNLPYWKPYKKEDRGYLHISGSDTTTFIPESRLNERCIYLNSLLPAIFKCSGPSNEKSCPGQESKDDDVDVSSLGADDILTITNTVLTTYHNPKDGKPITLQPRILDTPLQSVSTAAGDVVKVIQTSSNTTTTFSKTKSSSTIERKTKSMSKIMRN